MFRKLKDLQNFLLWKNVVPQAPNWFIPYFYMTAWCSSYKLSIVQVEILTTHNKYSGFSRWLSIRCRIPISCLLSSKPHWFVLRNGIRKRKHISLFEGQKIGFSDTIYFYEIFILEIMSWIWSFNVSEEVLHHLSILIQIKHNKSSFRRSIRSLRSSYDLKDRWNWIHNFCKNTNVKSSVINLYMLESIA